MTEERLDPIIAGALYDFAGWLTSRPVTVRMGASEDSSPVVAMLKAFMQDRGVDQQTSPWIKQWPLYCGRSPSECGPEVEAGSPQTDTHTSPYHEGFQTAYTCKYRPNPYQSGTAEHKRWMEGWADGWSEGRG